MTVYLDVIFFENLIMNLAIILSEAILLNSLKQIIRKILAATVASLFYIVSMFYNQVSYIQIIISFIIIKIAFNPVTIKSCIKEVIMFYFISLLFGGLSFAMVSFFNNGKVTIMNGILISNFSVFKIFLCGVIGMSLVIIILKKKKGHVFKNIVIAFGNKLTEIKVLLDTGNLLREPYTNKPVIIVEKNALKEILNDNVIDKFQDIISGKEELPIRNVYNSI